MWSKFKTYMALAFASMIGFFVWKNNKEKEQAKEDIENFKDAERESSIREVKEISESAKKKVAKELKAKIEILKGKEEQTKVDQEAIQNLERQLSRVDKNEKVSITV